MADQASASNPLMKSALVGVVLQILLAVLAKYVPSLGGGVGQGAGIGIGGVAGLLFSLWSKGAAMPNAAGGGAVAGGLSGLIGTLAGPQFRRNSAPTKNPPGHTPRRPLSRPALRLAGGAYSKRSRFITLIQAATKSWTNFARAYELP